jgi:MarR family transcriptional regulator, negative regulator of the multidrug operon emrRAB
VTGSENRRLETLVGALVTALSDSLTASADLAAGHTGATAAALTYLTHEPGLSIDRLKGPLGLSQSATVRLVDRLAADGLVQRWPGQDARSIAVYLTGTGAQVARNILEQRAALLSGALAPLGEHERTELTETLEKMLQHLTADVVHARRICRFCERPVCPNEICPVAVAAQQAEYLPAAEPDQAG